MINPRIFIEPSGDLVRCPCCGGMVQMPCVSCYLDNGNQYPWNVLLLHLLPRPRRTHRHCTYCQRTLPIKSFGMQSTQGIARRDYYHVCSHCRQKIERQRTADLPEGINYEERL